MFEVLRGFFAGPGHVRTSSAAMVTGDVKFDEVALVRSIVRTTVARRNDGVTADELWAHISGARA
jgi:hypothetical protein